MKNPLDRIDSIIISARQADFSARINVLRKVLIQASSFGPREPEYNRVIRIIEDVFEEPDKAVAKYTRKFDKVNLKPSQFRIAPSEIKKALAQADSQLLNALRRAIGNVRAYQSAIFIGGRKQTGIKYSPIQRVGICVPGASAPLPSTVIMTALPAQVAGVKEIAIVSPPRYNGSIHPVTLAVCGLLGIDEIYRVGGAQAVAAMACTGGVIPRVDKIAGPGNKWVQTAKKLVFGLVGIDSIAGPSEVLVIADKHANPEWVAADMLSQAEHAPGSAILATDSRIFARKVLAAMKQQLAGLSRSGQTADCIVNYSRIIVFSCIDEAIDFADDFAPEHLQVNCGRQSRRIAGRIKNAGAIFIGPYSPVALGDYWAGPSHTLPTGTSARFFSALSSNDFIKSTSIVEYSRRRLAADADGIIRLAQTEGLDAHANSIRIRHKRHTGLSS